MCYNLGINKESTDDMITQAPDDAQLIDYRKLEPFQGDLKDLKEDNYKKLLNSIETEGFFVPVFVWKDGEHNYLLDGHGRLRVLTTEKIKFENSGYKIPCYYIPADSYKQAKARLLKITSQYQTITYEGLQAYIDQAELPEAEIYQAVQFDTLPLLGQIDGVEHVTSDGDFLTPEDEYNKSQVNQIILIFNNEQFKDVMPKLQAIFSQDSDVTTPSELFIKLVDNCVNENNIPY